jgi:hypothetical protein
MRLHGLSRTLALSISLVMVFGGMAAAAIPAASDTSDPRDRMNIWEGRWKEVVETKETPYSHAASVPSHLTCAWTADRGYMVCEYLSEKVAPGQGKPSDHLSIFTYKRCQQSLQASRHQPGLQDVGRANRRH